MSTLKMQTDDAGRLVIDAKVVPGGSRDQLAGLLDGAMKIKVTAAPEGGKANKAVCALVARTLGIAKRQVQVIAGHSQPYKKLAINGINTTTLKQRWSAYL